MIKCSFPVQHFYTCSYQSFSFSTLSYSKGAGYYRTSSYYSLACFSMHGVNQSSFLVMIASIIINWFFGLMVSKKRDNKRLSRIFIGLDVAFNLAILFVFKYLTFTDNIIDTIFGTNLPIPNIALPIGISFFTFQAMSYVIDVYREKGEVQTMVRA